MFLCGEDGLFHPLVRFTLLRVLVLLLFSRNAGLRFDFALVIGISFGCAAITAAPPKPHLGHAAGGAPKAQFSPRAKDSTAPFSQICQSILSNLVAQLAKF